MAAARAGEAVVLAGTAAGASPFFDLRIDGAGGRVGGRGSVAWLSVGEGAGRVIALADDLQARCPADLTLGPPPKRATSAHLTVARGVDTRLVTALRQAEHGPLGAGWTAQALHLYRSHLTAGGSWYESLAVAPLRGAA